MRIQQCILSVSFTTGDTSSSSSSDLIFHPAEGTTEFSNLVRLCPDPSLLGDRLLDAVAALAGNEADPSQAGKRLSSCDRNRYELTICVVLY